MTTATKNSQFKIDFKANLLGKKATISCFSVRWRWSSNKDDTFVNKLIREHYISNKKTDVLLGFLADDDIKDLYRKSQITQEIQFIKTNGYEKWITDTGYEGPRKKLYGEYDSYNVFSEVERLMLVAATRSPEMQDCEKQFQKWLTRRPGVKEIWEDKFKDIELNLKNFSANFKDSSFRTTLENSRPRSFSEGTLVELKPEYVNKRGKDPFYYAEYETRQQPRIGMVAKFEDTSWSYGVGSRMIKVMWIANGSESSIMERCLNVIKEAEGENNGSV